MVSLIPEFPTINTVYTLYDDNICDDNNLSLIHI